MKPIPFKCPACNKSTNMIATNSLIHLYADEPEYDFVQFKCECGHLWSVFKLEPLFVQLYALGIRFVVHKEVETFVKKAYQDLYIQDNDLMAYFHRILLDIRSPDEINWSEHK